MQRCNFTLDDATLSLLNELADQFFYGNKSLTIRASLEAFAHARGQEGWVIRGYTPVTLDDPQECHTCHEVHLRGEVLYRPVFEKGRGDAVLPALPAQDWMDCAHCVEKEI